MLVIVGFLVVIGAVLTGFTMAGGQLMALVHPSEIITIGGAALGALVVMSPKKVLIDLFRGVMQCIKGSPYDKMAYEELFKTLYDLLRAARGAARSGKPHFQSRGKPHFRQVSARFRKPPCHDLHLRALPPMIDGAEARSTAIPAGSGDPGDRRRASRAREPPYRRRPTPCRASASWPP